MAKPAVEKKAVAGRPERKPEPAAAPRADAVAGKSSGSSAGGRQVESPSPASDDEVLAPEIPKRNFVRKQPGERVAGQAARSRPAAVAGARSLPDGIRILGISLPLRSVASGKPAGAGTATAVTAAVPEERVPAPVVRLDPPVPRLDDSNLTAPVAVPVAEPIAVDTAVSSPPISSASRDPARAALRSDRPEGTANDRQERMDAAPIAKGIPQNPPESPRDDGFEARELELLRNIAAGHEKKAEAEKPGDRIDRALDDLAGKIREAAPELREAARAAGSALPKPEPAGGKRDSSSAAGRAGPPPAKAMPDTMGTDMTPARPPSLPPALPSTHTDPRLGRIDVQSDRQADFDQAGNRVIFTGKVELSSKTLQLRASRVELHLGRNGAGMDRVEATGSVVLRLQPDGAEQPTMATAGRVSYRPQSGELALYDWPKIQEGGRSHIATGAGTTMTLHTDGRMNTDGPNRTLFGN